MVATGQDLGYLPEAESSSGSSPTPSKRGASPSEEYRSSKKQKQEDPYHPDNIAPKVVVYQKGLYTGLGLGKITDLSKVPEGWNWTDYDIDENDIRANITRCEDRIEDGIMPQWWEKKLQYYREDKEQLDKLINSESSKLPMAVVSRIKELQFVKCWLEEHGDRFQSLQTIEAIIESYRSGGLTCQDGYVTYWSNGVQLSGLEKFDRQRFYDLGDKHGCDIGFWVEGGASHTPAYANYNWNSISIDRRERFYHHHNLSLCLRIPGSQVSNQLTFMDDTGASLTDIFIDDLEALVQVAGGRRTRYLHTSTVSTPSGAMISHLCEMEMTMFDPNTNERMTSWKTMTIGVRPIRRPAGMPRLGGPWLRLSLFTATAPTDEGKIWLSRTKTANSRAPIPTADIDNTPAISWPQPPPGVPPLPPPYQMTPLLFSGPSNAANTFWTTVLAPAPAPAP